VRKTRAAEAELAGLNDGSRFNLSKASVLLVEAPTHGLDITVQILRALGVRKPHRCRTPEDAMNRAKALALDLIICDGGLPFGGAYDFVSNLRRSNLEPNRYCPTILVAGHTPASLVEQARDCGANFVIAKPISPRVLLERIMWMAQENRAFIELESYVGPDRRFHQLDEGAAKFGRRREDKAGGAQNPGQTAEPAQPTKSET
jgi:CheY-like chemotaxis protein